MKTIPIITLLVAALCSTASAEKLTFDFKDPKGVNNVTFTLDAPLESISGTASGVSGTIQADPANPADVTGKIVVTGESLHVPNPVMKEHLQGADWLDIKTHETISFEVKEVTNVKKDGNTGTADVTGTFTLKGVSKDLTLPVKVTYLPGRLKDRGGDVDGDLLVIRANWTVKRSDFGIKAGEALDKVSDEIQLSMSIAGASPKK